MACSKRSFLMTLALAVTAACTVAWDTVATAAGTVYTLCTRAVDWVIETVADVLPRTEVLRAPRASVLLVQARAFVLRLAKRETPRVTPGWRMCPSI
jgi:hypothetical protein